jgi:uncharacterized protein (TIGR04255 family)
MGEILKNPPLIEAVFEMHFGPGAAWDWTMPGRLYDRLAPEFGERSQSLDFRGVNLPVPASRVGEVQRVQLRRADGSAMIQIGQEMLAINHYPPYPSWEVFRDLIMRVVKISLELGARLDLTRLGLRYINIVRGLPDDGDLSRVLSVLPTLSGSLRRPSVGLYVRCELAHEDPIGVLVLQTALRRTAGQETGSEVVLDLDFIGQAPASITEPTSLNSWLEAAHKHVEDGFIAALAPEMYAQLQGNS